MKIGGFLKASFVDYPGKIASVVFTQGCNLRCSFCHNAILIDTDNTAHGILPEEIFEWLAKRKGMIDSVVVTGGEPTLQPDLKVFIEELKAMSFLVKLDTNGTNPDIIRALLDDELLDFIAMDIKAPLSKYDSIAGTSQLNLSSIRESAEIIKNCDIDYEFRTTFCPELATDDIPCIILDFDLVSNYVVQNCRNSQFEKRLDNKQSLRSLVNEASALSLRGFELG
ncbi:anaerobic ribonucleoside-triphosphate reductase activating protein [Desulfosporosinus orientis DSM 765]|uniref:Anaerobic ribonucleoside-triphosphate reductase activating protein n=1 Tax=Desulfosporosinus orientis (strain ATCC 19365 / DSM 765 / NCIMB 8382 / VKM B-1628 / Singapore I) TaxID=768706 RepID=G7WA44_DESOD|nr:anaerobic ribonucleoside-triphosphate reductase activating protein [Desulfosporosinus orientis]AET66182.1 anaerobic ribonucleoside-triphosphate reductase activating protein [Desulfosporosinus orientis DSM 765]